MDKPLNKLTHDDLDGLDVPRKGFNLNQRRDYYRYVIRPQKERERLRETLNYRKENKEIWESQGGPDEIANGEHIYY